MFICSVMICEICDLEKEVKGVFEGKPLCGDCNSTLKFKFGFSEVSVPGKQEDYDPRKGGMGINIAERLGRSPAKQEEIYRKILKRDAERYRQAERSGDNRNNPMKKIATIPREAWIARTRQHGKDYWQSDDPKKLAKRDGFLLEDN